jgi:DNA-binding winged helix-turn-helix (wHTH) protein/Flp pilus assembly protein TadD
MSRLLAFGPFRLDAVSRVLTQDSQLVPLPGKAIEVLFVLVKRRGEVVPKNDLMEEVWPDAFVEEGNLTQHIHVLRKALQDTTEEHRYILTVPGRGYSFVAPVQEIPEVQPLGKHGAEPIAPPDSKGRGATDRNDGSGNSGRLKPRRKRALLVAGLFVVAVMVTFAVFRYRVARYLNNKGVELQTRGELQGAIHSYRRALLLRPSYAEARYNLADAYEEIPDFEKAVEEYQKAIDLDVTFYEAYNNLARLYILRRKDPGAAIRLIDRGLSSNPEEKSVRYTLHKNYGWANLELRNYLRAEQDLRLAIELDPGRGAAHCLLAQVFDAGGKTTEAYTEWGTCLAFSGQSEVEPEWRNEALERLSKKESAK